MMMATNQNDGDGISWYSFLARAVAANAAASTASPRTSVAASRAPSNWRMRSTATSATLDFSRSFRSMAMS